MTPNQMRQAADACDNAAARASRMPGEEWTTEAWAAVAALLRDEASLGAQGFRVKPKVVDIARAVLGDDA